MARRQRRSPASRSRRWRPWRWLMGTLIILAVASAGWVLWLDHQLTSRFQGALWSEPASVYARPLELYAGRSLTPEQLVTELEAADYRQASGGRQPGTWARDG
ncbi:MAG: penicillin-binding protein 1B, partial [Ectothiorhodospiraceae bacterium]